MGDALPCDGHDEDDDHGHHDDDQEEEDDDDDEEEEDALDTNCECQMQTIEINCICAKPCRISLNKCFVCVCLLVMMIIMSNVFKIKLVEMIMT